MAASPQRTPDGVGVGMVLTIAVLAAAAAVLAVLVVTRHDTHQAAAGTTTSVVRQATHKHHAPPTASTTTTQTTSTTQSTTTTPTTTQAVTRTVPSLSGDLQAASQRVYEAGLTPVIHYVPSDQARGTVVAQSPSPGSSAPSGSQVTINVSSGQGTADVTVPNTVGMTVPAAQSALNGAGLHLVMLPRPVTSQSEAGHVIAQTPGGGAKAPSNSRVLVYWGTYKK